MTGLYVHVPFCLKKCHYCNFVTTPAGSAHDRSDFFRALSAESASHRERFSEMRFETLYLGGGTPSALDAEETEKLFSLVRENFLLREGAEVTVEANPGDVTADKAALYRRLGVTRVSLGAQTFREESLRALNRAHGAAATTQTMRFLRDAGIDNISLDLMLGLPGESLDDVRRSLEAACALSPEHVSLYELVVEEKTVFAGRQKKGLLDLPDEALSKEMLSFARDYLKAEGYRHYELLSYARPGRQSRHNLLYWANEDYLGLGAGAYSYFDGRRFTVATDYGRYLEKAVRGDFSPQEEERLKGQAAEREAFLLAMRLAEGASLSRFASLLPALRPSLDKLMSQALVEQTPSHCRLTARGQFFAETVFAELSA